MRSRGEKIKESVGKEQESERERVERERKRED
jgi:hypothetical protein